MSRSVKKGPYVEAKLMSRILAMNEANEKKVIKTWSRASTIFPDFVGHTIAVYDGRKHVPVYSNRMSYEIGENSRCSRPSLDNLLFICLVHSLNSAEKLCFDVRSFLNAS